MNQMHRRSIRIRSVLLRGTIGIGLGASFLFGGTARAQVMNPKAVQGKENTEGVFVRDSAVAVDRVYQAKHMEDLKEWDRAAEVYQDILKNYADRMIPSDVDKQNEIYQYGSVTPLVQEKLAKWSPEALSAYRARYENEAAALLETAHDNPAVLHRVMSLYFITDAGKEAAMRLMDLYFERGEFSAVAWIGQRLASLHPFLTREKAAVLFRASLAYHLSGDDTRAQQLLKQLKDENPDATAMIRGTEVKLSEMLERELTGGETQLKEFSIDSWPIVFGSRDRSRIPEVETYGGAKLFSIEVEKPRPGGFAGSRRNPVNGEFTSSLSQGMMTGILPVVDRGELFFQDNANIYAVDAESGYALPGWAESYPGEKRGHYSINAWSTPRSHQSAITVTEDSVYAVMGQPDLIAMDNAPSAAAKMTRLVCLDRKTGKERWIAMPSRFPDPLAGFRGLDLSGSPLVVGDLVYIQARGGKGIQFEDSYVMAFDRATGQLKWNCYVASANSGQQFLRAGLGTIMGGNSSHLAYYNGRLYACTNVGAIAAIDAYAGTIEWLDVYPRNLETSRFAMGWGFRGGARQINQRLEAQVTGTSVQPWKYNPVIVSDGKVFVLPNDGMHVLIYDAGTGAEFRRIPLSALGNSDVLLGVADDKLVLNNDRQVFCVNWKQYDPNKPLSQNVSWYGPPVTNAALGAPSIMGRGFVTADSVLIPMAKRLVRLSLSGGKIEQVYPSGDSPTWPEEEGPGNILVTQDRLIVAGPTESNTMRVNVYTDLALATKKLEADIAAAPDDPAHRLRYADIMFAAGKVDVAIAKLDEAISLLSGPAGRNPDARTRIFTSAINFGQKLARDADAANAELVPQLYDRAGTAAVTPSQKVEYRLARANFAVQRAQFDVAVRFFQQILLDESIRNVPVSTSNGDTVAAGELARGEIQSAIVRAGVAVYEPYEKAATDAVLVAARAGDTKQLQNIVLSYPNSTAASRALQLAADIYEAGGNARLATQVLRQAFFERSGASATERARILEALARNYLRLPGGVDIALARLNQAAAIPGANAARLTKPMLLPDGRPIDARTLAEAAEAVKQFRQQTANRSFPDIALPSTIGAAAQPAPFKPEDAAAMITDVQKLVVPAVDASRNDRIITYGQGSVKVYSVGKSTPILTSTAITDIPMGAAWSGGNLVIWSTSQIALLAPETGQTLWTVPLKSIAPVEVVTSQGQEDANPEIDMLRAQRPDVIVGGNDQQLIINGRIVIVQGRNLQIVGGAALPEAPPRPAIEQIAQVRVLSDRVLMGTTEGRLIALSMDGGRLLWQQRPGDSGFSHLVASEEFVAARVPYDVGMISQLVVFDASTGQVLTRRIFGSAAGDSNPLVNIALAPDGTLVYLTFRALYGKDLFERDGLDKFTFSFGNRPGEPVNFSGASSAEHLQIFGDKIVAVASDGAGSVAWVLSLRDGSRIRTGQHEVSIRLDKTSIQSPFLIRRGGSSLYAATSQAMYKIDMDNGQEWPAFPISTRTAATVRDLVVARGHLVLLTDLAGQGIGANQAPSFFLHMQAFSRAPDPKGVESGLCEFSSDISTGNAMLSGWQVVDGGMYYHSGDMRLHFLPGAAGQQK